MKRPKVSSRRVRVLESVAPPGPIIKFIDEIVLHAPAELEFSYFSWRAALFGRFDVFHVHWPEFLIRHPSRVRAALRRALFRVFLLRMAVQGTPVIRTVHNAEPHHAGDAAEGPLLKRLDEMVVTHVVMSDCTPVTWTGRTQLIPHGHFREPFGGVPRHQRVEGRVLLFGRIRPYKGVVELIRAAEEITAAGVEVRIVGSPTEEMRAQIDFELAKPDRGGAPVSVELKAISDEELVREISEAELIALPYRDAGNGNSGAAMLALSLDRPVLTPRSCLMEHLADEVGEVWIQMMDHEISAAEIEPALIRTRELAEGATPQFVGRDWPTIATSYADVFKAATGGRP